MTRHDFTALPDLASRTLGGSVSAANDELFAQRENLIRPEAPFFDPNEFGHKGKVYDGWETRRRRDNGHDYAIVRLGTPRIIHGIIVDTPYFKGNYPPFVSIEAARLIDHISVISEISCCAMGSNVLVLNRSARVCALRMSGTGVLGQSFAPVVLSTAATAMRLTT